MGIVEDLEGAIDIVDLVGRYTKLKKAGANYKSLCPFPGHNEKTPSFVVSPSKQIGYCFGCHRGGGPIKFVMDIENCNFKESLEILGSYTGIQVNANFDEEKFEAKKNMYSLYKDTTNYYKSAIKNYPEVKKYLYDRGLDETIIQNFHIGYADSGVSLYNYLKGKGYDDNQIEESQIFLNVPARKDKFIGRVIFPIQNSRGDFVAFAGRILDKGEPKYLNSPASKIYDKSNILYNLFGARNAITKEDFVIVCEGYMDTIALNAGGFLNSVSVSGTALTEKHLKLLGRLTKKIYLCFDGDSAGEKATKQSLEKMKHDGFEVKIIALPNGKDPDDIIKSGKDFGEYIKNALTPIGYYIKKSKFDPESLDDKKKLLQELLDIIKSYSNNVEKDYYLREVSKLLDIREAIVYDTFNRIRFQRGENESEYVNEKKITALDIVMAYSVLSEKYREYFQENIIFESEIPSDLKSVLENGEKALLHFEISKKEDIKALALQLEMKAGGENSIHKEEDLEKSLQALNKELYNSKLKKLKERMHNGDNEALLEYSKLIGIAKKHNIK